MRFRVLVSSIPISVALLLAASGPLAAQQQSLDVDSYKNSLAPYVNSPQHAVDKMLQLANLKPGETLYDLGCGDGRILIAAAEKYKAKGVGVEISNTLARRAAERVHKAGLSNQVTIVHGDFMRTDLSHADVVTLYLATTANENLRPNLEHYLRPNSRVVSYDYPIPGWKPIDTVGTEGRLGTAHTIYLYEVPNSIVKK